MRLHITKLATVAACTAATVTGAPASAVQSLCSANPQTNVRLGVDAQNTPSFLLNGQPWKPRGLQIRGFVSSIYTAKAIGETSTVDAQKAYGQRELNAAITMFNADMVRIQVSQGDLDPEYTPPGGNPPAGYKAKYLATLYKAIQLARTNCFVVIISMQAEPRSGVKDRTDLPSDSTIRAWTALLSGSKGAALTADQGIMLEIYNEPPASATADNWGMWAHAANGTRYENATDHGEKIYGMQYMIDLMRKSPANGGLGSDNVLVVDGLASAHTFDGVDGLKNPLVDPLSAANYQIAYAVHPYFDQVTPAHEANGAYDYPEKWGFLHQAGSTGRPPSVVFVSEWSAQEGPGIGLGFPPNTSQVTNLLNYMISNSIPMSAGAFDIPKIMVQEIPVGSSPPVRGFWKPTNYDNYDQNDCAGSGNNAGLFIKAMFESTYSRQLVSSDGVSRNQSKDPLWCKN